MEALLMSFILVDPPPDREGWTVNLGSQQKISGIIWQIRELTHASSNRESFYSVMNSYYMVILLEMQELEKIH